MRSDYFRSLCEPAKNYRPSSSRMGTRFRDIVLIVSKVRVNLGHLIASFKIRSLDLGIDQSL